MLIVSEAKLKKTKFGIFFQALLIKTLQQNLVWRRNFFNEV